MVDPSTRQKVGQSENEAVILEQIEGAMAFLDTVGTRAEDRVYKRMRLEHRIQLLEAGDPDLIEELARTKLMDGAPGQVAIPRQRQ